MPHLQESTSSYNIASFLEFPALSNPLNKILYYIHYTVQSMLPRYRLKLVTPRCHVVVMFDITTNALHQDQTV